MQGEHSMKGPTRWISAGSQRKGNMTVGWAVLKQVFDSWAFLSQNKTEQQGLAFQNQFMRSEVALPFGHFPQIYMGIQQI